MNQQMTGFILENVQVATIPFIESDDEGTEEPNNPLLQLVHKEESSRKYSYPKGINKLMGHIVRLDKKVHNLERRLGSSEFQQRLWLAPTAETKDDSNDDSDSGSDNRKKNYFGSRGSKSSRHASPKSKKRVESQPVRLEKVEHSCFARLLFSRCWTGKERSAGWKIQRKCPTQTGSLSCPCGMIGPCQKLKANPVPIDRLISSNKNSKPSPRSCSVKGNGCKKQETPGAQTANGAHSQKLNEKPLFEKLFPCCFKEHAKGACCSKGKSTKQSNKEKGFIEATTKRTVPKRKKSSLGVDESNKPTRNEGDDDGDSDEEIDSRKSDVHSFNVQSEDISLLSHKSSRYLSIASKRHRNGTKSKRHGKKRIDYCKYEPESVESIKFKLHPGLSEDLILQPEVVSHQILKTLSTTHGPMKVEQNIVVRGAENSVIVTHGESCQCCLCQMLKGKLQPAVVAEGDSPHIEGISSGNGQNTYINHSDGCQCGLCRVLDSIATKVPGSSSNESSETFTPEGAKRASLTLSMTEDENPRNEAMKTIFLTKKAKNSAKNGKRKVKKCKCSKCSQRRTVEKLKLKLKKGIGEYDRILSEITRGEDIGENHPSDGKMLVTDGGYTEPRRSKKSVSFPDEPDIEGVRTGNSKCKLCEVIGVKAGAEKKTDAYAMSIEQRCFPPMGLAKKSRQKRTSSLKIFEDRIMEDVSVIDLVRRNIKLGSHGSERSKLENLRDDVDIQDGELSPILFMNGEHAFVYLSPLKRPHVAAACSSESYYAPDQDEFPIANGESDEPSPPQ